MRIGVHGRRCARPSVRLAAAAAAAADAFELEHRSPPRFGRLAQRQIERELITGQSDRQTDRTERDATGRSRAARNSAGLAGRNKFCSALISFGVRLVLHLARLPPALAPNKLYFPPLQLAAASVERITRRAHLEHNLRRRFGVGARHWIATATAAAAHNGRVGRRGAHTI